MSLQEKVTTVFKERYGAEPEFIVRAPGRVNLIGEHTDYNEGFVLPMAIDRAMWIALRPRDDEQIRIAALDVNEEIDFNLDQMQKGAPSAGEYVKGVATMLQQSGYTLKGWEGVMSGDVPVGSGLSSSAALELAICRAFACVSGFAWEPVKMAQLSQQAEITWMGVSIGIMDQLISATGREGEAVMIDCRTLELETAPLPDSIKVVILDTGTRRGLVDSAYNERRQQCEKAATFFGVPMLRDVTLEQFTAREEELDDLTRRRARHIITENARVLAMRDAMHAGDVATMGQIMNEGHQSLSNDFEVSSEALDIIVEFAQQHPGCIGARMTGAGFGGCAVAIVSQDAVADFVETVSQQYQAKTPHTPAVYVCKASPGASVVQG